ncbi:MAG: c-type cytochrome [Terriglobia bacterium]
MMRRSLAVLLISLSAAVAVAAVSRSHWEHVPAKDHARANPLAAQPEAAVAGALVYREHCLQCHKADARGDGHRRPSLHSKRLRTVSDGDIEWFLRQGDRAHGMPSWSSLPRAQRWQLVAYLRSIQ